jgi:putative hydrolase of the HAD superfamily
MSRIQAITFDAGGTLLSPRESVGATYARLARAAGIEAGVDALDSGFARAFAAAPPLVAPRGATGGALHAAERRWWRDLVRATLCDALGDGAALLAPEAFARFFAATFEHYARPDAWQLHDDAIPCLEALRDRGLRLGVLSNFDSRLHGLIDGLGLGSMFRAVLASTELGSAKPDAAAFAGAARALDVTPRACLHVGDSLEADARGAEGAGWTCVWLDRRGAAEHRAPRDAGSLEHRRPPEALARAHPHGLARISSLAELPAWLDLDSP